MDPIIPQPQPMDSAMPSQAPQHRHLFNKKFAITLVVLLLLGTGAYAGIWIWQNQQVAQEVVPTFTPRADVTADWKTYTNTQYGFEIKYPTEEYLLNASAGGDNQTTSLQKKSEMSNPSFYGVSISVIANPQKLNVKDYFILNYQKSSTGIPISVNDYDAYTFGPKGIPDLSHLLLTKGAYAYVITFVSGDDQINQILSTFKFTDTSPSSTPVAGMGILSGHVIIGPNCPVEQVGNPCTPAPQAYTSRQVMVYKADGATLVTTQNFDTQGNYNIALPAGTYVLKSRTGISSVASVVGTVTIKNSQTSTLNFSIDTGIR